MILKFYDIIKVKSWFFNKHKIDDFFDAIDDDNLIEQLNCDINSTIQIKYEWGHDINYYKPRIIFRFEGIEPNNEILDNIIYKTINVTQKVLQDKFDEYIKLSKMI